MSVRMAAFLPAMHAALKSQAARINELNVYPVPDGDTGTNMLLTLEYVLKETSGKSYENLESACKDVARAALMGARGNSGVLLSQMIRGAADVLSCKASLTAEDFVEALEGAKERAYSSLRQPVEGTMLTVIKDASVGARGALEAGVTDLSEVIRAAAKEAHASVRRSPEKLESLREAGVVDAGGLGVAVILDGLYTAVSGEDVPDEVEELSGSGLSEYVHASAEERWGYCTEFMVNGFSGDPEEFEEGINELGQNVLVVADEDLVRVHLHTQDPGGALSYACRSGRLSGVKVEDMEAQTRARTVSDGDDVQYEFIAVAASRGEGNREFFESMGAFVVDGGQGENPSAADFARVVEKSGARTAVLLPNNKNAIAAAESVEELVEAEVYVIPTACIASGLVVMVGFEAEGNVSEIVGAMEDLHDSIRYAEITRAVRSSTVEGREIPEGAFLGFVDGELCAVEERMEDAAFALARELVGDCELITLLCGEGLGDKEAQELVGRIRSLDEEIEVELRYGGQPLYPLQMVAE
jgi:DAK2 domain fusion protein YloV